MRCRTLVALVLVSACGSREPKISTMSSEHMAPSPLAADIVAGVDSAPLKTLLADHWEWNMRANPTWATTLGDHRFDDQLQAYDLPTIARQRGERDQLLGRARAIDAQALSERDRLTLSLFVENLEADAGKDVCHNEEWLLSARENVFHSFSYIFSEGHQVKTPVDAKNFLARLQKAPRVIDDAIASLRTGLKNGRVASAEAVRRTVAQLDGELTKSVDEWAMTQQLKKPHADWAPGEADRFAADVRKVVGTDIKAAVARFRDMLRDEVLPRGRTGDKEGLAGLPGGDKCYLAMMRGELASVRDPKALHQLGLEQIARSDKEIAALGKKVLGTSDLKSTIAKLRTDKSLYFTSREQILETANAALARARAAIPRWFGILPKEECIVSEIPAYEAPFTTIAYYREANFDGSKPGEYFVNTYRPETRPRFDFEALSWHESIPGHHLQIAIAHQLGALPLFRRLLGTTAFVEGWALYTERLADEMGLYSGDTERLGMWSYDAWRGSRLVVDTGMNALGWTREQAEKFMLEHTALAPENVSNEVDRYLSTPAQALAYKVGQLDILDLRAQAEKALGKDFDIRRFHDVVLGAGAVTLPVLEARVHAWIEKKGAAPEVAAQ